MAHWFTIKEAANYFRMKRKTLYSLAARGRLPKGSVLRLGRSIRLDVQKIEKEANERRQGMMGWLPSPVCPDRLHTKGSKNVKK